MIGCNQYCALIDDFLVILYKVCIGMDVSCVAHHVESCPQLEVDLSVSVEGEESENHDYGQPSDKEHIGKTDRSVVLLSLILLKELCVGYNLL